MAKKCGERGREKKIPSNTVVNERNISATSITAMQQFGGIIER